MFVRCLILPVPAAAAAVLLITTPATAALPAFGTAPVSGGGSSLTPWSETGEGVSAVTVGHHAGYDRVVFTFRDHTPRFEVSSYGDGMTQDETGAPVPIRGSAFLRVMFRGTTTGMSDQRTITPGFPMLKQIKGTGDFEGDTSYGIGVASRSGFRAFTLTGPNRLVIDIAIPSTSSGGSTTGSGATGSGSTGSGTTGSGTTGSGTTGSGTTRSGTTGSESTGAGSTGAGTAGSGGLPTTGPAYTVPLVLGGLGLVGLGGAGLWLLRRRFAA